MSLGIAMCRVTTARSLNLRPRATTLADTVVHTFQQAHVCRYVVGTQRRGQPVVVVLVEAELGLDGGAVDAVRVEALPRRPGQLHIPLAALRRDGERNLDVHRSDDLGVRQLPDVDVVAANHPGEVLDVLPQVRDVDVVGRGLEEDLGRGEGEGEGGAEDDECDEEGDGRIGVEPPGPVGQPDYQGGDNDSDVSQGVAQDVENHAVHPHVAVTVPVALPGLLGLVVVVVPVEARVSTTLSPSAGWPVLPARCLPPWGAVLDQGCFLVGLRFGSWILAITRRRLRLRPAGGDNILPEASRVDAHILDVTQPITAEAACPPPMRLPGLG